MDEKRQFFRIKNNGEIEAQCSNNFIEILEISSTGCVVKKPIETLKAIGTLSISIHNFSIHMQYEVLRTEPDTIVLVFTNDDEMNRLFVVLRKLRDEQRKAL